MRHQPHNLRAWVRGRSTYGWRAQRPISRNRLPTVLGETCRLCIPTVLKAVSVAVRWRFRKCARRIVLSWRRDVTLGRPDPGQSAKCPVSLKRLTRCSIVETLTPKWLATCCCLWPCISNAIAVPLWTSVSRTMIEKKFKVAKKWKEKLVKESKSIVYRWSVPNGVRKSCAEGLNMLVLHEILAFRIVRAMHCVVHGWMISHTG